MRDHRHNTGNGSLVAAVLGFAVAVVWAVGIAALFGN